MVVGPAAGPLRALSCCAGLDERPIVTGVTQVLYAWFMVFGMMGLSRKVLKRESYGVRYVSDASYWLYITHLPLVVAAQVVVQDWRLPAIVKFMMVCVVVTGTALLIVYDKCVRYGDIGAILNGRKTRPQAARTSPSNRDTVSVCIVSALVQWQPCSTQKAVTLNEGTVGEATMPLEPRGGLLWLITRRSPSLSHRITRLKEHPVMHQSVPSQTPTTGPVDRRIFLKTGVAAVVGAAAAGTRHAAAEEPASVPDPISSRAFGKTVRTLPILAYGGAALPRIWGNPLATEDRVKLVRYAYDRGIRYFDTAGNYMESQTLLGAGLKGIRDEVYLVTKVETTDPDKVRGEVEQSLKELQTDYLDAILIHGTPGLEQMTIAQAMKIHAELVKLRTRGSQSISVSAHSYFDKALALIPTGGFDQCMLSYGCLLVDTIRSTPPGWLNARRSLAKAHELGMGIAAMKVNRAACSASGHVTSCRISTRRV